MVQEIQPEDAFRVAERIEENATRFYKKAADLVKDEEVKHQLMALADWENKHRKLFANKRTDISDLDPTAYRQYIDRLFPPDDETAEIIRELADSNVFLKDMEPSDKINENSSVEEILELALSLEKDAVIFYTSMKEAMGLSGERDAVSNIINEEMKHIVALNKALAHIRK